MFRGVLHQGHEWMISDITNSVDDLRWLCLALLVCFLIVIYIVGKTIHNRHY